MDLLALGDIAAQPWKNGAGITREIAVQRAGGAAAAAAAGADAAGFDWRISLAEVSCDAPFSAFPGVDRTIVLLRGAGMRLASADGRFSVLLDQAFEPRHFSGDLSLTARLIDGPCSDLNVMIRRGAVRCELTHHDTAAALPGGDTRLLWCCDGDPWEVAAPERQAIGPMQGLLWRSAAPPLAIRPLGRGHLLDIRLCQDRSR